MSAVQQMMSATQALTAALRQKNRILRLSFPADDGPAHAVLLANRLDASEAMNRDFRFVVEVISDRPDIELKDVLGKRVTVQLVREDGHARYFNGHVFAFRFMRSDAGFAFYEMELGPWLRFLSYRTDNYLFHGKRVEEQTAIIFGDYAVAQWQARKLDGDAPMTDACQFDESDYNYLHRRWEALGWCYFYEHTATGHTLVLSGDSTACEPVDGGGRVTWEGGSGTRSTGLHVFSPVREVAATTFAAASFDFKNPSPAQATVPTINQQGGSVPPLEVYEYTGGYGFKDGDAYVRRRIEAVEAQAKRFEGEGDDPRVAAGRSFHLEGHLPAQLKGTREEDTDFLVLEARHSASNNYEAGDNAASSYANHLVCLRKKVPWRPGPGLNSVQPRIYGAQTALVVGPAGEEIHTDEYGRVRVQFHWDREGSYDEKSSAWVRVATSWAGSGFGMVSLPRIGQEVIVTFLDGNPDRPIITGSVYNQRNMPPWPLPANKTQSGILSRSTKGGGGDNANAIRFEDKKGEEELWLHAEKDQRIEVENDERHWVGRDRSKTIDRDETVHVKRDRAETVDHDETITVHHDRTERVDHDEKISIGGHRDEDVAKNESIKIGKSRTKKVGKNETDKIGKSWSIKVGRFKTETVKLASMQNVGLAKMVNVGGAYDINVGLASIEVVGMNKSVTVMHDHDTTVSKAYTVKAGGEKSQLKMDAETIVLSIGDSSITLTKDKITIASKTVEIAGSSEIDLISPNINHN